MQIFFHITSLAEWDEANKKGSYTAPSLATEGFIHCSFRNQVCGSAERHFKGRKDLILLEINPARVKAEVKLEGAAGNQFPHIYGELNLNAVEEYYDFPCLKDGTFELPEALLAGSHL